MGVLEPTLEPPTLHFPNLAARLEWGPRLGGPGDLELDAQSWQR